MCCQSSVRVTAHYLSLPGTLNGMAVIRKLLDSSPRTCGQVVVQFSGRLAVGPDSGPMHTMRFQKVASLFALLCWHIGKPLRRREVIELLWCEDDPGDLNHRLRETLRQLQARLWQWGLDTDTVERWGDCLAVRTGSLVTDVQRFRSGVAQAVRTTDLNGKIDALNAALGMFPAPFLGSAPDDWILLPRQQIERERAEAAQKLVVAYRCACRLDEAVATGTVAAQAHPYSDGVHLELIRSLGARSEPVEALRVYEAFVARIDEEFGLKPSPGLDDALEEACSQGSPRAAVAPRSPAGCPTHMVGGSEVVGRDLEIETLQGILGRGARIATVYGAPGVGKTTMAQVVARRLSSSASYALQIVDLAELPSGVSVWRHIAGQLGCKATAFEDVRSAVLQAFSVEPSLVVLDSCEADVEGARHFVGDVVDQCPNTHFLACSRSRLRVRGEHPMLLPPLEVPSIAAHLDDVSQSPAGKVLLQAASEAGWSDPRAEDAPVLARLCEWADGVPGALRIAGGWLGTRSPQDMLAELGTGGPGDKPSPLSAPDRTTLSSAVLATLDLLDTDTLGLSLDLSLVAGEVSSDEAVLLRGSPDAHVGIATLAGNSLLHPGHAPGSFRILRPVRRVLVQRAIQSGGLGERYHRISDWICNDLDRLWPESWTGADPEAIAKYERIHARVLGLLDACVQGDCPPALGRPVLGRIKPAIETRRFVVDWQRYAGLADGAPDHDPWRGPALLGLAADSFYLGEYEKMRERLEGWEEIGKERESLEAARRIALGVYFNGRGDHAASQSFLASGIALARSRSAERLVARGLFSDACRLVCLGEHEASLVPLTEATALAFRIRDRALAGACLQEVGEATLQLGDVGKAIEMLERAHKILEDLDDRYGLALVSADLGFCHSIAGDHEAAVARFVQALKQNIRLGMLREARSNICHLADALTAHDPGPSAALICQSALSLGAWRDCPADRTALERALNRLDLGPLDESLRAEEVDPCTWGTGDEPLQLVSTHLSTISMT